MSELSIPEARAAWSAAQGLDRFVEEPVEATLERCGWVRTLGGLAGYLALSARNPTATVEAVHEAIADGRIGVSPSVRGCIYLVPRSQAALALRIAEHLSARRTARDHEKLGLGDDELDTVGEAVLAVVADRPLDTAGLRRALPEGTVRSLGDAGKKVGVTSTLPPALRRLELQGRLRRQPVDARLDHERYSWAPDDLEVGAFTDDDLAELATLYLRWAGPSTRQALAAWTGLNQTAAKKGLAAVDAATATLEGEAVHWLGDRPAPTGQVRMLPAMDALFGLRRDARQLVDPRHHDVPVTTFGRGGRATLAAMSQPIERTLVRDGEVVGLWAYDPTDASLVVRSLPHSDVEVPDTELDRVRATLDALGHGKSFSLDRDDKLAARATRLRAL